MNKILDDYNYYIEDSNGNIEIVPIKFYEGINPNRTYFSDRLYQWDSKKYNSCHKKVFGNESQYFNNVNKDELEEFLKEYIEVNVKVISIIECKNISNGFPYWRFDCYVEDIKC
ncbi:MAG: hypothetical protein K0R54_1854 [Clostridiaceae bacterium]|jgi:hypothetical protein|nr:hypothetical protein [Clostridiaceae bacterium]